MDLDITVDKFAAPADRRVQFNYYVNSICKNSFKTCNFNLKALINCFKKKYVLPIIDFFENDPPEKNPNAATANNYHL